MKLLFLGTGTSTGVPVVGCTCEVCTSSDPRNRRLRTSILWHWNGQNIVVDTGPDFRQQMLRAQVDRLGAVLYTHAHADHLFGLDDVRPFCFRSPRPIPVYGEEYTIRRIQEVFHYCFMEQTEGGAVPRLELREIKPYEPFGLFGKEVLPLRVWHGSTPVLAYRVDNVAYATDCSRIPPETMALLTGLDVLILDALRYRPHSTHFSILEALEVVQQLRPRQAYFVHMTHEVDHVTTNAQLPPNVQLAYDGLMLDLDPSARPSGPPRDATSK